MDRGNPRVRTTLLFKNDPRRINENQQQTQLI